MEASKLQKKKKPISKGKIKKTMKNILCRPDPTLWPAVSDEHEKQIKDLLHELRVDIHEYKKPHWSEIKNLPKDQRPRAPIIKKVEGLLFGITTCYRSLQENECSVVLLEGNITPQLLVEHVINKCKSSLIPILAIKDLKQSCKNFFGLSTSCLGLHKESKNVSILKEKIIKIAQSYDYLKENVNIETMDCDSCEDLTETELPEEKITFNYVYRTSKTSRGFIPPTETELENKLQVFKGQDFIELSDKTTAPCNNNKSYMNVIVKKITSNPNRKRK